MYVGTILQRQIISQKWGVERYLSNQSALMRYPFSSLLLKAVAVIHPGSSSDQSMKLVYKDKLLLPLAYLSKPRDAMVPNVVS